MVWLRSWTIVLVLCAFASGALFVLSPYILGKQGEEMVIERIRQAQSEAPLWLKLESRSDLDALERTASDAVLIESIGSAGRPTPDLNLVRRTVLDRLRTFQPKFKAEVLVALDATGKVLARVGQEEDIYGDSLLGFPVIADALRGIHSDDTWSLGGKLYRVAAVSVIGRDRYLGALLLMREVTPQFAREMKQAIGTDVAFVVHERVVCASDSAEILTHLATLGGKAAAKPQTSLAPQPLDTQKSRYWTVRTPWVGEAAEQGATYVLFTPAEKTLSLTEAWTFLRAVKISSLPWAPLRGLMLLAMLAIIVGFLLFQWEIGNPLRRLNVEVRNILRGLQTKVAAERYPLGFASLARGINLILDRLAESTAEPAPPAQDIEPPPEPRKKPKVPAPPKAAPESLADFAALKAVPAETPQEPAPAVPAVNMGDLRPHPPKLSDGDADLKVFQEYIETRRRLGEPTQGLTFEKVFDRLRSHRADLLKKYNCVRVDFQVYVKDGKAAIKARPVFEDR